MSRRGFTLIELLVVIAIIALLSSVVLSSLNTARAKARDTRRQSDVQQLVRAVTLFASDNSGNYPGSLEAFGSYTEPATAGFAAQVAPYITAPRDPIQTGAYHYYVIRADSTWITNNSWASLSASCAGRRLIVARTMEGSGAFRQDCPGTRTNMLIISLD